MRHVVVVALLLVCAFSGAAAAQESPGIDGATTTFDVDLRADGDADWTVRTSIPIDTDEERAGFRTYAERFEAGNASAGPGIAFFRTAADAASTAAQREMEITTVERSHATGADTGTLILRFRWSGFLAGDGERYELGDALLSPEGTWLRSLTPGQELRIRTPPGYDIQRSIEARQENESLVVAGPDSFDSEEPLVVYRPVSGSGTGSGTQSPAPPGEGFDRVAAALLGLLFLVVAVLALWRWRGGEPITGAIGGEAPPTAGADTGGSGGEAASGVDHELLSDEERVEALLEEHGGRMRQADIVSETDWSDAKVSQLLSRMADEGSVEKLRLGRENVISLPDAEDE